MEGEGSPRGTNAFGDVVRGFDLVADSILTQCIADGLGDVTMISEESEAKTFGTGKWIALVDPVDGSTNVSADIPWAAVSIAVARKEGCREAVLGDVVYSMVAEVFRERAYVYCNGKVEVRGRRGRGEKPRPVLLGYIESYETCKPFATLMEAYRGPERLVIRSLGSASLDVVHVALGDAMGFIDARAKLRNFDVAAALRIALALGSRALLCGGERRDVLGLPVDRVVRVPCLLVAFNDDILNYIMRVLHLAGLCLKGGI